jgi:hypothetical protein
MQHFYTVIYKYDDPRHNHEVEFEDLKKARADIEALGKAPHRLATPRPKIATLRGDGKILGRYQWPKDNVVTVDAYFDFPHGLTPTGKTAKDAFKSLFEQWVVEIRRGGDLGVAASMVGGTHFWNMLDNDMLYPRTIKAELVKNLSYGEDTVFVRFHVRKPPTKTGRTVDDGIWFSC